MDEAIRSRIETVIIGYLSKDISLKKELIMNVHKLTPTQLLEIYEKLIDKSDDQYEVDLLNIAKQNI